MTFVFGASQGRDVCKDTLDPSCHIDIDEGKDQAK